MDDTYAPQSPDLSGFLSSSPAKQSSSYSTRSGVAPPHYVPRSPIIPASFGSSPHQQPARTSRQTTLDSLPTTGHSIPVCDTYMPPIPPLPASHHSFGTAQHNQLPVQSEQGAYAYANTSHLAPDRTFSRQPFTESSNLDIQDQPNQHIHSTYQNTIIVPPIADQTMAAKPSTQIQYKNPNPQNIIIRTKFPIARIKRIMQADEEVGKVAQATPVAVTKALELFMIALVTAAAEKAKEKGGKRIGANHLKTVVENDKQWDFLEEIVGRLQETEEKECEDGKKVNRGKRAKSESSSDEEAAEEIKKRRGRGRRKKGNE